MQRAFGHWTALRLAVALACAGVPGTAALAGAATYCLPRVFETPGSVTNTPYTYDTVFFLTYTAGLAGTAAGSGTTASLYLLDETGAPMTSGTGEVVCAPCVFSIGSTPTAPRKLTVRVNDLIMARGGFGTSMAAKKGIGLLDLTNDVDWLSIESRLEYSDAEPGDLYLCPVAPRDVLKDWFVPSQARVFVLPEVRDRSESGSGLPKVIDCYLTAAYVGGLGDVPAGTGATVELYLYDDNGAPMSGSAGPICAPCSYTLGTGLPASASRWLEVDIGNLSPVPATKQGFAVVRVAGADPGAVVLEQFEEAFHASPTARSHSGRLLTALALPTGTLAVDEPDAAGATLMLRSSPNPAAGAMTFDFDLAHRADVDLDVFDAAGRRVATVYSGARPAGRQSLQWNRRDDQGNTMAAGIYYGRLRANDGSRVTRLVFLP